MKRRALDTEKSPNDARRRRSTRGTLRKYQEIDHVRVEDVFSLKEPGLGPDSSNNTAGEGCYVAATIRGRRFFGCLIEQDALKKASLLHFQNTATSLEINRRMKMMKQRQATDQQQDEEKSKQETPTNKEESLASSQAHAKQVQKFRYVQESRTSDYRVLLATFVDVDAASEEDQERRKAIEAACQSGGDFVGKYYYQYQPPSSGLEFESLSNGVSSQDFRLSMGFDAFLQNTTLPEWFPLSNLEVGKQQVLDTLGMKKDTNGMLVWDGNKEEPLPLPLPLEEGSSDETLLPMQPRSRYRVVVVGAGLAGLSTCLELFQVCERDGIDVEVTLVEGRSRLGGRIWTDKETFSLPVDLGANWIHGIDGNPLAAIATDAKVDFIRTSEEVTMLLEGGDIVDRQRDEHAGELFDSLLDLAVESCWRDDGVEDTSAVRWYSGSFRPTARCTDRNMKEKTSVIVQPKKIPTGPYRVSPDKSVDKAIGNVVKGRLSDVSSLSEEGRRMLSWNIKNIEYALGTNISDLSMKFWDIDERNSFEGDHVILKQGFSSIIQQLYQKLEQRGERFTCLLGSPVKRIEYGRKTTCNPYFCPRQRQKRFVELSDACQILFENEQSPIPCDFVVSAVPLGVLKDSIVGTRDDSHDDSALNSKDLPRSALKFEPELPFSKKDAIESVGFGLLDKIYLQFQSAFWRTPDIFKDGQTSFGNASSTNPQHFMFLDMGLILHGPAQDAPPLLMTLISGQDAAEAECLSEEHLVSEVMKTLRTLFEGRVCPDPISFVVTRWGRDRFSRGSFTYLPPDTTDQDFGVLQSPVNANGDSILLDGSETMRLFFAGEHTSALHPSLAHGAMLSGFRAAKEIVQAMTVSPTEDTNTDRPFPLPLFRQMNPKAKLNCALCHLSGSTVREGTLVAFKRGAREILVHSSCAENCPEVYTKDGGWQNVIKACNRGKGIECSLCSQIGATIGCMIDNCTRSYHFSCAEDTGWRFDIEGKDYVCGQHRTTIADHRKISLDYYLLESKEAPSLACALCGIASAREAGELLAFQKGMRRVLVHEFCARYTSTCKIKHLARSRLEKDYDDVFAAVDSARTCGRCSRGGATIECSVPACNLCYHFPCARSLDWDFAANKSFRCISHRNNKEESKSGAFQHALFSFLEAEPTEDIPVNQANEVLFDESMDEEPSTDAPKLLTNFFRTERLSEFEGDTTNTTRLVNATRPSQKDKWELVIEASINEASGKRILSVAANDPGVVDGLYPGDIICSLNGNKVGSPSLDTVEKALKILSQVVEVLIEVCDSGGEEDVWGDTA